MHNANKPYRCGTVSCGLSTPVHLSSETPSDGSPAAALCGVSCCRTVPALMFLDTGCAACATRAVARGITVAGDWSGGVSLQRLARAS
jgi:hypothetical protein